MTARHSVSLTATDTTHEQIETVRRHYHEAVSPHRVLTRAAEIGLQVLAAEPELLIEKQSA